MTKPGRIPCINPTCKRTAPADKYQPGTEIICGKCFKALPADLKADHRRCWREINKWRRRITKTSDELKIQRLNNLVSKWAFKLDMTWLKIRTHLAEPERPAGIENFLREMGLE
jgi:hypothetical protein